jgi:hypothetical protein
VNKVLVDDSRIPLVRVTFPDNVPLEELHSLFARYELLSRRHPRVAYLIDFTRYNPVLAPNDVRKTLSDLFVRHRETLLPVTVCEARIVPSMVVRAALTAFDSITTQKWPCASFATEREAVAWIDERLARDEGKRRPGR